MHLEDYLIRRVCGMVTFLCPEFLDIVLEIEKQIWSGTILLVFHVYNWTLPFEVMK